MYKGEKMTYTDVLKSGFGLVNRNWQLVVVQVVMMIATFISFFVVVGIPLFIAFVLFGLDLTGLAETHNFMALLRNPTELLSKYMGIVLIVVTSFVLYFLIVTTAGLFVFGGTAGTIGRSVLEPSTKFSMKLFFAEAKKLFFPLMWFFLFMGLIFAAIAFFLGLFGGGALAIVQSAKSQDSTLALFLGIFFFLVLTLIALIIVLGAIAVTVYGIAVLFFKNEGAIRSFRDAVTFLWNRQSAFWFYAALFFFYLIASFILMLFTFPFKLIPIIGTIISFPLQLLSYVLQSYIGLVIMAATFIYYHRAEIERPVVSPGTTEARGPLMTPDESSSDREDISAPENARQEEILPEKEPREEA